MNKLASLGIFALGATFGSLCTYLYINKKYNEEYFVEYDFDDFEEDDNEEVIQLINPQPDINIKDNSRTIDQYTNYTNKYSGNEETNMSDDKEIMTKEDINEWQGEKDSEEEANSTGIIESISAEEFGEKQNYDTATIMYYDDGTLATEDEEIIDDVDGTIGTFSNYLDNGYEDTIYIRNHKLATDYEVIKVNGTYEDNCVKPY